MKPKQEQCWNYLSEDDLLALVRQDCEPALAEMARRARQWRQEWIERLMHRFGLSATDLPEPFEETPGPKPDCFFPSFKDETESSILHLGGHSPLHYPPSMERDPVLNLLRQVEVPCLGKALAKLSSDELHLWILVASGLYHQEISQLFHIPVQILKTLEIHLVKRINELLNKE